MNNNVLRLIEAQNKAADLFSEIEKRNLISAGKSEKQLNTEIFELAYELFGIQKYSLAILSNERGDVFLGEPMLIHGLVKIVHSVAHL